LVFAYGIDGEKRGLGVSPSRAILNPEGQDFNIVKSQFQMQSSTRAIHPQEYEYIEGGDFRVPLKSDDLFFGSP
jgi:hypothetical protein